MRSKVLKVAKDRATKKNRAQIGIIDTIIGFIVVFYALSSTYGTLETSATSLTNALGNATLTGVSGLSGLPAVAVLLFLLIVIFSIVQDSVRGGV